MKKALIHESRQIYLRSTSEFYEASVHYQQARKMEPKYLKKSYWWFEYAGVLYLLKHYTFAEHFYKKSIKLGSIRSKGPIVHALVGDCEFSRYKFGAAVKSYKIYLKESNSEPDDFY